MTQSCPHHSEKKYFNILLFCPGGGPNADLSTPDDFEICDTLYLDKPTFA
jgi:hypothetical protein